MPMDMDQCCYVGHIVGRGEVHPESEKLKAVESFPTPKTKKEVRIFLGLMGYYRTFIPSYSTIAAPLTDLIKKKAPKAVIWTEKCETALIKLKQLLCSEPVLQSPDFSKLFILQTDASNCGVGAVLSQWDSDGTDHPVGYFSRKLLPREEAYSTIEKKA